MKKKSKRKVAKKPELKKRALTAADKQNCLMLAAQLGSLIALDGYRSSFSLVKVAQENGLKKFLPKKSTNKQEAFTKFIENVLVYRPRTLKKLVREILPKAIDKRLKNGNPILEAEASTLSSKLFELGIDLRKEIVALKFPKERPTIIPPPIVIQKILDAYILHPTMLPDCKQLFIEGHINESVRKALEKFEKTVQQLSFITDKIGPDLMALAFSETDPKVRLNDLSSKAQVNEQIGFKLIAMGMMHWWRNNLSHGDEKQIEHHDALGRLIVVSNFFHRLDNRKV